MAAGLGFKTFTTGEVLTAADTNGYLMQGVLVFASAAARDAAITSPQEGQFAYLKDTNVTTYYTGAAWANLDTTGMTNPMTTTGDIVYASSGSTPGRIGIGSTGNVLTVAGGIPSWAAPAGGAGLTLIIKSPFTTVSSHSVDDCFTSTYANYKVLIKWSAQSADDVDVTLRLRASGSDTSTNYNCQRLFAYETTVATDTDPSGNDDWIAGVADKDFAAVTFLEMEIASPQVATTTSMVLRQYGYTTQQFLHFVGGRQNSSTQFDGIKVLANTGTMSGTVWVYGYKEA